MTRVKTEADQDQGGSEHGWDGLQTWLRLNLSKVQDRHIDIKRCLWRCAGVPRPFYTCHRPIQSTIAALILSAPIAWYVPTSRLSTFGSRAFPVAGLQTWNDLPEDVTSAESLATFCCILKTHLFRKSFPDYLLLDINWLSPVDLAVVLLLRPPKKFLKDTESKDGLWPSVMESYKSWDVMSHRWENNIHND